MGAFHLQFTELQAVVCGIENPLSIPVAESQPSGKSPAEGQHHATDSARNGGFGFPLPIDPIRLVAGVLTRWPLIFAGLLIFGAVGIVIGIKTTKPTYTVSTQLIKRRVPETVQTSDVGNAYRPADFNDATLLATLLSPDAIERAVKRAANGLNPDNVRGMLEASQLEGTDLFYVTYHSPVSPEDAVKFATIYAEEINSYTRRLQQSEASEVRAILQKEVADFERQLDDVNREIQTFCREKDYLGGDTQVAAALAQLGQIDLQLQTARTAIQSKTSQIEHNTQLIRRQSPIGMQLKTAQEELANLRSTYTDANPLVQAKLESIEFLNKQNEELMQRGNSELDVFTGTPLGNQLFLDILNLNNEITEAKHQTAALEALRQQVHEKIDTFPALVASYEALLNRRATISQGLSLMGNRLKEAEIFSSGAPGYWQIFQAPQPQNVLRNSLVKKPLIFGIAGGAGGGGMVAALMLLFTQRSSRRSILECCAATRAPLRCFIPTTYEKDARAAVEDFWVGELYPKLSNLQPLLIWTPAIEVADERRMWSLLAAAVMADTGKPILVDDLSPNQMWHGREIPDGLIWREWNGGELERPEHAAQFLRASALPVGAARELFMQVRHWLYVVEGQKASLRRARKIRSITDAYLPKCAGTIAWMERPSGSIREVADLISTLVAKYFSK